MNICLPLVATAARVAAPTGSGSRPEESKRGSERSTSLGSLKPCPLPLDVSEAEVSPYLLRRLPLFPL